MPPTGASAPTALTLIAGATAATILMAASLAAHSDDPAGREAPPAGHGTAEASHLASERPPAARSASRSGSAIAVLEIPEAPADLVPETPAAPAGLVAVPHVPDATHVPEASSAPEAITASSDAGSSQGAGDMDWDRLAACESGHGGPPRWDHNRFHDLDAYSDARFYGGLHFNKHSWDWAVEVGGHDVPYWPHEASREQQIAVAETLRRIHPAGWGAWPECSRRLGLR